jgi:uncharacterized SAM-binding protein YcdF (DUF218 family)
VTYTEPLTALTLALLWIGIFRLPPSRPKRFLAMSLLLASLLTWPPFEYILSRPLESRYPLRPFRATPGLDAIVVLSSAVSPPQYERPYPLPDPETFARCQHAAWIHRNTALPVLASGGAYPSFAVTMRDLLVSAGVPPERIWLEERSQSTHENAVFSARILRQHGVRRIILVVDARSMTRAAACFRHEGIEVVAAPSKFLSLAPHLDDWIPGWKAVRGNELSLHEMVGLLWYRLRGWI